MVVVKVTQSLMRAKGVEPVMSSHSDNDALPGRTLQYNDALIGRTLQYNDALTGRTLQYNDALTGKTLQYNDALQELQ